MGYVDVDQTCIGRRLCSHGLRTMENSSLTKLAKPPANPPSILRAGWDVDVVNLVRWLRAYAPDHYTTSMMGYYLISEEANNIPVDVMSTQTQILKLSKYERESESRLRTTSSSDSPWVLWSCRDGNALE